VSGVRDAVPATCPDCGGGWTWRAAWWESPAADPVWGYLMHCAALHWHWYAAPVPEGEREAALRRFGEAAAALD